MSSGGEPEPAEPKPDTAEPAAAILEAEPVAFEQPAAALDPAAGLLRVHHLFIQETEQKVDELGKQYACISSAVA